MSLKSAATLALVGTFLLTLVLLMDFFTAVSGVMNDVVPAMALVRSLIWLIAGIGLTVFFFAFVRTQR
jgi:hypothetical protein